MLNFGEQICDKIVLVLLAIGATAILYKAGYPPISGG